ncbi:response regulator [Ralstonia solanacearum]|uniref:Chemotaxis response regulator protein n=1 Tax=Ralstonia solanacearum (strain Po82) TaxID=1031711 RepID=F6G8S1_RALS8|nr:response regulator [Ralstonia solanacearum]AEG71290.1 chemotaxis response regulator protein [Ralstonia solanacearum Po82]AMP72079.1 chemotaxis protein [Ralstonia solanacearum]AMP75981.1 chemotaxis protein [Ralstonia solanacearum]AYB62679.1 response regulator [Ralstonia solanacearum]EUJ12798.1 chemotaxis protein [Ralstonia solanacearum P673]
MSEKHILVVDDSTSIRRMIAACLRECGFAVTEAADGTAALAAVQRQTDGSHHLVITDQVMPSMDGLTLIRALRTLPAYADTPILMLTTEADSTIRDQARAAGATGFLPKPFDPDGLTDSVMQLLEWHAQTHGSTSTH